MCVCVAFICTCSLTCVCVRVCCIDVSVWTYVCARVCCYTHPYVYRNVRTTETRRRHDLRENGPIIMHVKYKAKQKRAAGFIRCVFKTHVNHDNMCVGDLYF